jgi:hypothetical protein
MYEGFTGWGGGDDELFLRLPQPQRLQLPLVHMWHPKRDRSHAAANARIYRRRRDKVRRGHE